ncbi:DinB family protein [Streptomyces sp. 6N223]|uniref:DinB family protein n=1 Tax=Streptomyces sp. 6N223 TaxID=3457412 RepID=UPI003FD2B70A
MSTEDTTGTDDTTEIAWQRELVDQLDWHWRGLLRPRFEGLTDEECLWEPAPGCWSVRPDGAGGFTRDDVAPGEPDPEPAPLTTIAWRMGHLIADILGGRASRHFGGPPVAHATWGYAGTAAEALAQLDEAYERWMAGVRSLDEAGLARRCGPAERLYPDAPLAALVLHINRETIHHGAEIALLRDLYRAGNVSFGRQP